MEHGGSMPHSQGLSNNSYPEPNQPRLDKIIFHVNKILKLNTSFTPISYKFMKFSSYVVIITVEYIFCLSLKSYELPQRKLILNMLTAFLLKSS